MKLLTVSSDEWAGGLVVVRKPYLIKILGLTLNLWLVITDCIILAMLLCFLYLVYLVPISSRYKLHDHVFHHVNTLT